MFQSRKGKPNDYSKWIKRGSNLERKTQRLIQMNKERFQSRKGKPNDYSKWIKRGSNREKENPTIIPNE